MSHTPVGGRLETRLTLTSLRSRLCKTARQRVDVVGLIAFLPAQWPTLKGASYSARVRRCIDRTAAHRSDNPPARDCWRNLSKLCSPATEFLRLLTSPTMQEELDIPCLRDAYIRGICVPWSPVVCWVMQPHFRSDPFRTHKLLSYILYHRRRLYE